MYQKASGTRSTGERVTVSSHMYLILTSTVIYFWTDALQPGIYYLVPALDCLRFCKLRHYLSIFRVTTVLFVLSSSFFPVLVVNTYALTPSRPGRDIRPTLTWTLYMKGVPFFNKTYTKGVPFQSKMVNERVRGWTSGALPHKTLLRTLQGSWHEFYSNFVCIGAYTRYKGGALSLFAWYN